MRAKSIQHAEYEIVKTMIENMGSLLPPRCSTDGGTISPLWSEKDKDEHATKRVSKAAIKIRKELNNKMEKLRKHLPENHVDYDDGVNG